MAQKEKKGCPAVLALVGIPGVAVVAIVVLLAVITGPQGCRNRLRSWSSSAYGSDWMIVQYAQDGSVITNWEVKNRAVNNEQNSDGIYFIDDDGNVVHLSGHYVYVEIRGDKWDEARRRLLPETPKQE